MTITIGRNILVLAKASNHKRELVNVNKGMLSFKAVKAFGWTVGVVRIGRNG